MDSQTLNKIDLLKVPQKHVYVPDHINVVLHSCINNPSEAELTKVCDLLRQYQSVFATSKDDLGETDCVLHIINTDQARFINKPQDEYPYTRKRKFHKN